MLTSLPMTNSARTNDKRPSRISDLEECMYHDAFPVPARVRFPIDQVLCEASSACNDPLL